MVYTKAKAQSDSEYNFSADSDANSSDAPAPAKPRPLSFATHLSDHSLINYKKSAQSWSIEQIADEINTLSAQLETLKSESLREPGEASSARKSRAKRKKNAHCFCDGKYSLSSPMVQCDHCDVWYHQICVGLTQADCDRINSFECIECRRERSEEAKLKAQSKPRGGAPSSAFGVNFEEIRRLLRENRDFYYKNKQNFIKLFANAKPHIKFAQKALEYPLEKVERNIGICERKLKRLLSGENALKSRKLDRLLKSGRFCKKGEKEGVGAEKAARSQSVSRFLPETEQGQTECVSDSAQRGGKSRLLRRKDVRPFPKEKLKELTDEFRKAAAKSKAINSKNIHLDDRDTDLAERIKKVMFMFKLSQKQVAKEAKLTGGSTTLSSWLNGSYVFNIYEKERQLCKWYKKIIEKHKNSLEFHSKPKPAEKHKSDKFSVNEKIDFLFKKDWIEGRIIKAARGQYLVRFKIGKKSKKKWVASMAKKVAKLYSKRSRPKVIKCKGVKKKVITKSNTN